MSFSWLEVLSSLHHSFVSIQFFKVSLTDDMYFSFYLKALLPVSEEVRSRCRLKHSVAQIIPASSSFEHFPVDLHLNLSPSSTVSFPGSFCALAGTGHLITVSSNRSRR